MSSISQYMRQQRIKAGLSQQQVAAHLQLPHRSMVHRRETGKTKWSFDEVARMAELLGVDLIELIKGWQRGNNE